MVSLDYAFYHIERVLRIMRGDASALDEMDISTDGFWRSFGAILFALPAMFFIWVEGAQGLIADGSNLKMWRILISKAFIDIVSWVLPFLIYPFVLKLFNKKHRYSHLVIAMNWYNLVLYYVVSAAIFLAFLLPETVPILVALAVMMFAVLILALIALAQVYKFSLQVPMGFAFAFITFHIIVTFAVYDNLENLLGLNVTTLL